ncbi:MAG: hypothetical protein US36_C0013G0009 [Candidatus Wolfebacteria bacterium GW2011_GWC1_37_10]|uniref:UPF0102 protein US36_C0013G0009 n=1 Tax=Candidatus Wolfebacteria bacterium GW2011_GWC1_37_10 TaxID=1619010 RepID=A0A0G0G6Z0_9BACT|nr:MAG: hypothetical protein US36_C0013G0009 [Candidatus Wolfebacteria bacterium GW2011_GWC1_37_10]
MNRKSEVGKLGENIACRYLVENNFKVIERNFRKPWGELDIVAMAPNKTLVFVEVKTIRNLSQNIEPDILPEEQLTKAKLRKLQRTASLYAGENLKLIDDERGWRIDLITLTINGENYVIKHYQNI